MLLIAEGDPLEEVVPFDGFLDGGSGFVIPPVTKETQVDGQDTVMVEKPKKRACKPKKP